MKYLVKLLFLIACACALLNCHNQTSKVQCVPCANSKWPVKTLSDSTVGLVDFNPRSVKVGYLLGLPTPAQAPKRQTT